MRHTSLSFAVLLALGACGSSTPGNSIDAHPTGPDASSGTPDASSDPFACLNKPLPTTAAGTIKVTGITEEIKNLAVSPLSGSTVTGYKVAGDAQVTTTTSASDGTFTLTLATGGAPLDGYVVGTHAAGNQGAYLDTYLYPPAPLAFDESRGTILMLTQQTLNALSGAASVTQQGGKGMIGLVVADCNGTVLKGAVVTSEPAGTVVYDANGLPLPSASATSTDVDGRAFIFNVGPGEVTVKATYNGMTLRSHVVNARADKVTTTAIQP